MSITRLQKLIIEKRNPTVAGLDARPEYVPQQIIAENVEKYGRTLKAAAESVYMFNVGLIDALAELVPAVKPQSAYYELLGPDGVAVLKRTIDYAKSKGLYVIVDGKRNDIGATATAYAEAYLGMVEFDGVTLSPFDADALTVNPYLGSDGIKPFTKYCDEKAIFVLAKTSNKSSIELQDMLAGDRPLYKVVASRIERWGADYVGEYGYSNVGAVVGATYPEELAELRKSCPRTFFLVPGYGAQGGTAADIEGAFDKEGRGAIINSSRGIMCAWQKKEDDGTHFAECAYEAALKMKRELNAYILPM